MFYEINTHEELLTIDLVGPVTPDTLMELIERVRSDTRYSPSMAVLYDLSRCDFSAVSTAQIRRVTAVIDDREMTSRLAIFAPDDLNYGMGRIYVSEASLLHERPRRVFKDYQAAIKWLASDSDDE